MASDNRDDGSDDDEPVVIAVESIKPRRGNGNGSGIHPHVVVEDHMAIIPRIRKWCDKYQKVIAVVIALGGLMGGLALGLARWGAKLEIASAFSVHAADAHKPLIEHLATHDKFIDEMRTQNTRIETKVDTLLEVYGQPAAPRPPARPHHEVAPTK